MTESSHLWAHPQMPATAGTRPGALNSRVPRAGGPGSWAHGRRVLALRLALSCGMRRPRRWLRPKDCLLREGISAPRAPTKAVLPPHSHRTCPAQRALALPVQHGWWLCEVGPHFRKNLLWTPPVPPAGRGEGRRHLRAASLAQEPAHGLPRPSVGLGGGCSSCGGGGPSREAGQHPERGPPWSALGLVSWDSKGTYSISCVMTQNRGPPLSASLSPLCAPADLCLLGLQGQWTALAPRGRPHGPGRSPNPSPHRGRFLQGGGGRPESPDLSVSLPGKLGQRWSGPQAPAPPAEWMAGSSRT